MRRPPLRSSDLSLNRDPRDNLNWRKEDQGSSVRAKSRRDDVEPRRATRFTPALRLCISGCVCSTKRSLLSVFVAPERDLRPHERSFGAKRARAPFRAQLRPAPSSFSTQDRLLLQLFSFPPALSRRVGASGFEENNLLGWGWNYRLEKVCFVRVEKFAPLRCKLFI